jgi:hypothetical protein
MVALASRFIPPTATVRRKAASADAGSPKERAQLIGDILTGVFGDDADAFVDDLDDAGEGKGLPWYCVKAWSEIDHPRAANGRFISRNSPEALAAAHKQIKETASQPKTPASLKALTEHLSILTVAQLKALKREHGLKGDMKAKPELVAKIAEKLQAATPPTEEYKPYGSGIPGSPDYDAVTAPPPARSTDSIGEPTQEVTHKRVEAGRAMDAERKKKQAERARELFGSWATGEMPADEGVKQPAQGPNTGIDEPPVEKPKATPLDTVTAALAGKEKLHSRDMLAALEKTGLTPAQALDAINDLRKQGKISVSRTDTGKWNDVRLKTPVNAGTPFVPPTPTVKPKKAAAPDAAAKKEAAKEKKSRHEQAENDLVRGKPISQAVLDEFPDIAHKVSEGKQRAAGQKTPAAQSASPQSQPSQPSTPQDALAAVASDPGASSSVRRYAGNADATLTDRLNGLANMDTEKIDAVYNAPGSREAGIRHNEYLRAVHGAWREWEDGAKSPGDKKRLVDSLAYQKDRIVNELVPGLRKMAADGAKVQDYAGRPVDLNAVADFYDKHGPAVIDSLLKTVGAEKDAKYGPKAQERYNVPTATAKTKAAAPSGQFSTAEDAAKATKKLHESMSEGSAPHGGYDALKAKVDSHLEKLAKLTKSELDKVWHGGLGRHQKLGTKIELLKKIGQDMMMRAGSYDRRNA